MCLEKDPQKGPNPFLLRKQLTQYSSKGGSPIVNKINKLVLHYVIKQQETEYNK